MNKELKSEAEKIYPVNNTGNMFMPNRDQINNSYKQEGFIAGATSKFVEKQKLEFAIEQFKELTEKISGYSFNDVKIKLQELEQQLKELSNE